jgi:ribonuclease HI/DNA polymerase-3 subunit epsilon
LVEIEDEKIVESADENEQTATQLINNPIDQSKRIHILSPRQRP